MKSDQYRESTGRRLRDAYMSEPVQRSASAEDFDKWKKAGEKKRIEIKKRHRKTFACAAVVVTALFIGVTCAVNPPQVEAGGKRGSEIGGQMTTVEVYKSQEALPEEIKEEFLLFPELPEGYEIEEVRVEKNKKTICLCLTLKSKEMASAYINETIRRESESKSKHVLEGDEYTIFLKNCKMEIHVKEYEKERNYKFLYEDVFVSLSVPMGISEEETLTIIEKAAL